MVLRERRIFIIFTLIYTFLIFLTSFFLEITMSATNPNSLMFVFIFFGISLFLSILYAVLLVARNKRTWATLKCIGYESKDVNAIIRGIIFFTMIIAFIIVIEVLFHYTAAMTYIAQAQIVLAAPTVLISLIPVVITSVVFLLTQIIAILFAMRKVLKLRPMIALKKPGEK